MIDVPKPQLDILNALSLSCNAFAVLGDFMSQNLEVITRSSWIRMGCEENQISSQKLPFWDPRPGAIQWALWAPYENGGTQILLERALQSIYKALKPKTGHLLLWRQSGAESPWHPSQADYESFLVQNGLDPVSHYTMAVNDKKISSRLLKVNKN